MRPPHPDSQDPPRCSRAPGLLVINHPFTKGPQSPRRKCHVTSQELVPTRSFLLALRPGPRASAWTEAGSGQALRQRAREHCLPRLPDGSPGHAALTTALHCCGSALLPFLAFWSALSPPAAPPADNSADQTRHPHPQNTAHREPHHHPFS